MAEKTDDELYEDVQAALHSCWTAHAALPDYSKRLFLQLAGAIDALTSRAVERGRRLDDLERAVRTFLDDSERALKGWR